MPKDAWRDWRQVAETFAAETQPSNVAQVVDVLCIILAKTGSWSELLAGGAWIRFAPTEVYANYVSGYREARTLGLLERLVRWLHRRGDIDGFRVGVLLALIDQARRAHFVAATGHPVVEDLVLSGFNIDRVTTAFTESLQDAHLRRIAPGVVDILREAVELAHGPAATVPMGAIEPDMVIAPALSSADTASRDILTIAARFYAWAAETSRMERARAEAIASRFAVAALALAA